MRPVPLIAFILLSLLSGAQSSAPADNFSITLERGPCEGFCPWYSVTILGNGAVRYEGQWYVRIKGVRKDTIPQSGVQKLVRKLRDEDFLHWTEKTDLCVDYPEVKITATLNGQHKQVLEGCKAPGKVLELADEIDRISRSHRWTEKVR
jgi:hypothetical protein